MTDIAFTFDGKPVSAVAGDSPVAALTKAGYGALRTTAKRARRGRSVAWAFVRIVW